MRGFPFGRPVENTSPKGEYAQKEEEVIPTWLKTCHIPLQENPLEELVEA